MKLLSLISGVNQNIEELTAEMGLESDAVMVNQCDRDECGECGLPDGHVLSWICMDRRGVGLSRNTCIDKAFELGGDILLFTDEDITYDAGYAERIMSEYAARPEADAILFNMNVCEARRTYWNTDNGRVRFFNYGRYPAYSISVKSEALAKSGVRFPLEFGGGAKYINGEDSVFLHDCLRAGMKIFRSPVCLGSEKERESTWFKGYDDRFFISRGALYVRLYGRMSGVMALVFLLRHRYMYEEKGLLKALGLMKQGMKEIREQK